MAYTSPYTGTVYPDANSYYDGGRTYTPSGTYIENDSPADMEAETRASLLAHNQTTTIPANLNVTRESSLATNDNDSGDSGGTGFDASDFANSLGFSSTGAAKSALGVSSLEDFYKNQYKSYLENKKRQEKQAREIGSAWDPVLAELDRRLGELPTRQAEYEGRIGQSTEAQLADVEASRTQSTEALQTEKARNLRDLEADIRNQIEAAGRKIGVAGAGSSSAVGQATEAVARVGQKARGSLMEVVTQKLSDVNNLATQERSKINQWKQDKLFEIVSYFGDKMDELKSQHAGAQKERKRAVAELIFNAEKEFMNAVTALDSEIMGYKQSVDMWERQRAAELEDYARTQGSTGSSDLSSALDVFNLLLQNGMTAEQARTELEARGIYVPLGVTGAKEDDIDQVFGAYSTYTPAQPQTQTDQYGFLYEGLGNNPTTGTIL